MDEENKIQDGEIVSDFSEEASGEEKKNKRKRDLRIEMVLFFILGILIGITLKTEAVKRITMGYNDYQMDIKKQDYDINKLQLDLAKKSAEEAAGEQLQDTEGQDASGQGSSLQDSQENGGETAPDENVQNQ